MLWWQKRIVIITAIKTEVLVYSGMLSCCMGYVFNLRTVTNVKCIFIVQQMRRWHTEPYISGSTHTDMIRFHTHGHDQVPHRIRFYTHMIHSGSQTHQEKHNFLYMFIDSSTIKTQRSRTWGYSSVVGSTVSGWCKDPRGPGDDTQKGERDDMQNKSSTVKNVFWIPYDNGSILTFKTCRTPGSQSET